MHAVILLVVVQAFASAMSYIPPHRRQVAGGSAAQSLTPALPPPTPPALSKLSLSSTAQPSKHGGRNLLSDPSRPSRRYCWATPAPRDPGTRIAYAIGSISRWLWVSAGGRVDPEDLRLVCRPYESFELIYGVKPLVLVAAASAEHRGDWKAPVDGVGEEQPATMARRILPDLLASAASAKAMTAAENEFVKLAIVARVGNVFFQGDSSNCLELIRRNDDSEANMGRLRKTFYTDVPTQLLQDIEQTVVPKAGFDFKSEKDTYHVKVFDKYMPHSTIRCSCTVVNGRLQIYRVELDPIRHLVTDVSCLHKDLDFRIILTADRILKSLDDEQEDGVNRLISAAIIDGDIKGGLRWPVGKDVVDGRFSVAGVWHTRCRKFRNSRMGLMMRKADRYNPKTSVAEASHEVTIKMTGIAEHLRGDMDSSSLLAMLEEAIEFIWNDLLCFKPSSS